MYPWKDPITYATPPGKETCRGLSVAALQPNASSRENSSRNWNLQRRFKPPFSQDAKPTQPCQHNPLASLTPHTTCRHETSDHEMPKPAPLALCLPLLARQCPSLPVFHLFNRLLVLRNLQARSPRTKPLPFSISSASLELGSVQSRGRQKVVMGDTKVKLSSGPSTSLITMARGGKTLKRQHS
jgi:hypothetical protein